MGSRKAPQASVRKPGRARRTVLGLLVLGAASLLPSVGVVRAAGDPVIGAAGDIACDPASSKFNAGNGTSTDCHMKATSNLLTAGGYSAVMPLGDNQYYCGGYDAFLRSYDPTWGRVKSISHPVVGNHEYLTSGGTGCTAANAGAAGYFDYFGAAAGERGKGWYSFDLGAWHLIALNSNCSNAGGCGTTSPQGKWLAADLAAHANMCTLAYWHIPRFSSGGRQATNSQSFWNQLYATHADVILNGHEHIYERFAPQTPTGVSDPVNGIREFVAGTGGSNLTSITTIAANSEVRNASTYGVLQLTLHSRSYDWKFIPEAGKTFTDSGSQACHASGGGPSPSPSPSPNPNPSPSPTPTGGTTTTFAPAADSYVTSLSPSSNYGSSTSLRADGSPIVRGYVRFSVSGLGGTVTKATLRVYANSSHNLGYDVFPLVAGATWTESGITYSNAPALGSPKAGSSGAFAVGTWTNVDVTALVAGNGTVQLAITTTSSTAMNLASRESGATAPQLVITTS